MLRRQRSACGPTSVARKVGTSIAVAAAAVTAADLVRCPFAAEYRHCPLHFLVYGGMLSVTKRLQLVYRLKFFCEYCLNC